MSRSTQFIGLTKMGQEYVNSFPNKIEYAQVCGMFNEEYPLYAYWNNSELVLEKIQLDPWSSGPMLFLDLKYYYIDQLDFSNPKETIYNILVSWPKSSVDIYSWIHAPHLEDLGQECDQEKGIVWI
jgi:hypothetical protein